MNKTKSIEFDCPVCGNPLIMSDKDFIRCKYCNQIIIPKSKKLKRDADIYKKPEGGKKSDET